ncbi:hypothetical protein WJX75_009084 [Coccomyxa subellipsoidea]|uniref:Uncharacterized protein n=1 Tax=Coccomyxa subellipsoidea TaxID=248742 RepID=A0ABR2YNA8_9CHLO
MAWESSKSGPSSAQQPLLPASDKEERPALGVPVAIGQKESVWKGTTWQDGCCGSNMETIDLRRVVEIHFHRSLLQLCFNRGTITIHSDHAEYPDLKLTTFGTRKIFERLREV